MYIYRLKNELKTICQRVFDEIIQGYHSSNQTIDKELADCNNCSDKSGNSKKQICEVGHPILTLITAVETSNTAHILIFVLLFLILNILMRFT